MKARILKPEEWQKLPDQEAAGLVAKVPPETIAVVGVEDDEGRIIASVCVLQITHFEGLWLAPEYRGNAGALRALIRQAYAIPQVRGESWALGGAADSKMRKVCRQLGGAELPMSFFMLPVGGGY